jgi:solute:Na+ symporter, SSS family
MYTAVVAAFFLYFFILLVLGLIFHKKQKTSSDFIMGNRSLSFWLVALSAHASDMSAWLFMAMPMYIMINGLPYSWVVIGLLVGMFLNWQYVAPKLREMTEKYGAYTLSTFFEKRFNDTPGTIKLLSAIVMIIFLTHYLSAGLIAMGYLLESLFGINYTIGLSVALLVVVIYTFFGGFTTVAWIDFFQGIFLLVVILIVPAIAFTKISGWDAMVQIAHQKEIPLTLFEENNFTSIFTSLMLAVGWGLGYFGMPHIITKFMGIQDVKEMYKSKWLGISWQLVTLGAAALVGFIGIAYFPEGLDKPQMVFVEMVKSLFNPFIGGFILCAVIAANMSTMDSQILVCGSIISEDLFKFFQKTPPSDRKVLWVSKLGVIFISAIALMLALNKSSTIQDTVAYSWSGLGSAFGPLVLMSLYSNKINRYGAIAGIIVGTAIVMIWPTVNPLITNYTLMAMIPGFFGSTLAIYVVSEWTRKYGMENSAFKSPSQG